MSGVLVLLEQRSGSINRLSFEALAAGQQLADKLSATVTVAVAAGEDFSADGFETHGHAPAAAYLVQHELLEPYTSDSYVIALEQLIQKLQPDYVLFPHTYQVRDFAPALATRFKQVLISDVISIHDGPVFVRQLLQGKLNADYKHTSSGPCFVSIQAGSFRADEATATIKPEVFAPEVAASQIRNKPGERFRESGQTVDLTQAPVIVSVGRGIGEQDNLAHRRGTRPGSRSRACRLSPYLRQRLASDGTPGWVFGTSGLAQALPRRRHLGSYPASCRHEGFEDRDCHQ